MSNLMEWDELHIIREDAVRFIREARQKPPTRRMIDEFCDYLEFVLCLIYAYGWKDAEEIIGAVPLPTGLDDKAVNLEINGETYRERILEQVQELSEEGILRIIDTEAHRDYNTGVYDAAKASGKRIFKRWNTMGDERVRDTHDYLEGNIVGLDDKFYTFDGDSALFPGGFELPQNNVNCRCWVTLLA